MLFHMVVLTLLSFSTTFLLVNIFKHLIRIFEISGFEAGFETGFETGLGGLVEIW